MGFQRYVKSADKSTEKLITISQKGLFSFNNKCVIEDGVDKFKYVFIDYDLEANQIKINFTNNEDEEGKMNLHHSDGKASTFSGSKLFTDLEISADASMRYKAELNNQDNSYLITLGKGSESTPRVRKPKSS